MFCATNGEEHKHAFKRSSAVQKLLSQAALGARGVHGTQQTLIEFSMAQSKLRFQPKCYKTAKSLLLKLLTTDLKHRNQLPPALQTNISFLCSQYAYCYSPCKAFSGKMPLSVLIQGKT